MFKNYFKTAVRNFRDNRFYSLTNISGLAIGIATCLLITLFVFDELGYERFNEHADRIFRVNNEIKFGGNHVETAQTPPLLGDEAVKEIPEVEKFTRLRWHGSLLVKKGTSMIRENKVCFADSTLFQVFTLPMISGDRFTALKYPHSLVITESVAKKYFNRTDIAGQPLTINETDVYKITGVIKDVPENAHFHFDFFLPFAQDKESRSDDWLSGNFNTYILLRKNASQAKVEKALNDMMSRLLNPELKKVLGISIDDFTKQGSYVKCSLTPLAAIHLHSARLDEIEANGNIQYVYIFSMIALFILIIACVNFMNLFTARSASRAKEIGVRKVLGSLRKDIVQQFLFETVFVAGSDEKKC